MPVPISTPTSNACSTRRRRPSGRARPRGRLLPGPDGGGRSSCLSGYPVRRAARIGPLDRDLAIRRPRRSGLDAEWSVRDVDGPGMTTPTAIEELAASGTCDVLAHPDLDQGGRLPAASPDECLRPPRRSGRNLGHGGGMLFGGAAQAGRRDVPGAPTARAIRRCRTSPFTTASDAHRSRAIVADRARLSSDCFLLRLRGRLLAGLRQPGRRTRVALDLPRVRLGVTRDQSISSNLPTRPARSTPRCRDHVLRLLGSWGVLSDLSFSDIILVTPQATATGIELEVIGQKRPATSATLVRSDMVGRVPPVERLARGRARALVDGQDRARVLRTSPLSTRSSCRRPAKARPERYLRSPKRRASNACRSVAARRWWRYSCGYRPRGAAPPGRLEKTYQQALRTTRRDGRCRFLSVRRARRPAEDVPRVGDGFIVVDTEGDIGFASPNAMSALHRMGVNSSVDSHTLNDLGVEEGAVAWALASRQARDRRGRAQARRDRARPVHPTSRRRDASPAGWSS